MYYFRDRLRAGAIHLAGSLMLAVFAVVWVFYIWYPSPLAGAVGVVSIFILLLSVDVVAGPLLTFLVYKPGKASLKFDLAVILVLQLSAFFYGVWSVGVARPAWIVFNVDRFDLVQAHALDERDIDRVAPEYRRAPLFGPKWVAAFAPASVVENNRLTLEAIYSGLDIPQRPLLYKPLSTALSEMRSKSMRLEKLNEFNSEGEVARALGKWPDADAWLPMMSSVRPMVVLMRKSDAAVVAVVDLSPWGE
ncbi:MAG: type IV pilin accessory protein [Gammaproteobacteria bacterium HGW-Gammaproteobacteria-13]|nr:MAG: type IV pilin accessory protein [Gammaproteobacteria bacterium HGW-Gammaproteobacteria-13]